MKLFYSLCVLLDRLRQNKQIKNRVMKKYFKKRISRTRISLKVVFVGGLLCILDGIIAITTLGYYHGNFAWEHLKENL